MSKYPLRLISTDITAFTVGGVDMRETFTQLELWYDHRGLTEIYTEKLSTDMGASLGVYNGGMCEVVIVRNSREGQVVVAEGDYILNHVCRVTGPGEIIEELYLRRHTVESIIEDKAIYHQE